MNRALLPKARMTAAPLIVSEYLPTPSQPQSTRRSRADAQCEEGRLCHAFYPTKFSSRLGVLPSVVPVADAQDQEADHEQRRD